MSLEEWKKQLEIEAAKYGLTLNDVVPEDKRIEQLIKENWSPKDEMDYRAEKYDLQTLDKLMGYGGN